MTDATTPDPAAHPSQPGQSPVQRLRALPRRFWAALRREEQLIFLLLLTGILLCVLFGQGFSPVVFTQYLYLFAGKIGLYFLATRLAFRGADLWHPRGDRGRRTKRLLFGPRGGGSAGLFETDLEFIRGLMVLFVTLSVYTNVKLRIPIINETVGDRFFQRMDHWIFGERLFPWLEQAVHQREWLSLALQRVYDHDYLFMVLLVFLLHLRRDLLSIRWCFTAVSITYLLAIFISVAYPTYGPCFVYYNEYGWLRESTHVGRIQEALMQVTNQAILDAQDGGWVQGRAFYGIAAFPSLHVGHMSLLVIFAWRVYRIYAPLVFVMTCLTFVATMAFGWHYAVDGIAGVLLALLVAPAVHTLIRQTDGGDPPPAATAPLDPT
ncbi:MAG: phosphatase PAP2 family protein [Acidobacteriota bacterium]